MEPARELQNYNVVRVTTKYCDHCGCVQSRDSEVVGIVSAHHLGEALDLMVAQYGHLADPEKGEAVALSSQPPLNWSRLRHPQL